MLDQRGQLRLAFLVGVFSLLLGGLGQTVAQCQQILGCVLVGGSRQIEGLVEKALSLSQLIHFEGVVGLVDEPGQVGLAFHFALFGLLLAGQGQALRRVFIARSGFQSLLEKVLGIDRLIHFEGVVTLLQERGQRLFLVSFLGRGQLPGKFSVGQFLAFHGVLVVGEVLEDVGEIRHGILELSLLEVLPGDFQLLVLLPFLLFFLLLQLLLFLLGSRRVVRAGCTGTRLVAVLGHVLAGGLVEVDIGANRPGADGQDGEQNGDGHAGADERSPAARAVAAHPRRRHGGTRPAGSRRPTGDAVSGHGERMHAVRALDLRRFGRHLVQFQASVALGTAENESHDKILKNEPIKHALLMRRGKNARSADLFSL